MTAVAKMLPPSSPQANHAYWLDATRDVHVATAPAFGFITVRDLYDKAQTLRAGRLWLAPVGPPPRALRCNR